MVETVEPSAWSLGRQDAERIMTGKVWAMLGLAAVLAGVPILVPYLSNQHSTRSKAIVAGIVAAPGGAVGETKQFRLIIPAWVAQTTVNNVPWFPSLVQVHE